MSKPAGLDVEATYYEQGYQAAQKQAVRAIGAILLAVGGAVNVADTLLVEDIYVSQEKDPINNLTVWKASRR